MIKKKSTIRVIKSHRIGKRKLTNLTKQKISRALKRHSVKPKKPALPAQPKLPVGAAKRVRHKVFV